MHAVVRLTLYFALLLIVTAAGCGGNAARTGAAGAPTNRSDPGFTFPPLSDLAGNTIATRSASSCYMLRSGNDFDPGLAQRATAVEFDGLFEPAWQNLLDGADKLAYAVYRFNVDGHPEPHTLRLTWFVEPVDYSLVWIGLSNWAKSRWDWFPGTQQQQVIDVGASGFAQYSQGAGGDMLVVIVVLGTQPVKLRELLLGPGLDDTWWSYGHDRQHTHRSPYQGPVAPNERWNFTSVEQQASSPAIGADGAIYATWGPLAGRGLVRAINPDGSLRWDSGENGSTGTPAVLPDGTIYVAAAMLNDPYNVCYALNPDGTPKWTYSAGPPDPPYNTVATASPAVAVDGTVYLPWVHNNLPGVLALNPDGTPLWNCDLPAECSTTPALALDGTLYLGSHDKNLYAIATNGTVAWAFPAGDIPSGAPTVAPDGSVLFGCNNGTLYALLHDGTLKWDFPTGGATGPPAVDPAGNVYFISGDGNLYALNADGTLRWNYTALNWTAPPVIDANGVVYSSAGLGFACEIYALRPNGTLLWSFHQGSNTGVSMPAIGGNCVLYVGCGDGSLLALGPYMD